MTLPGESLDTYIYNDSYSAMIITHKASAVASIKFIEENPDPWDKPN